MDNILPLPIAQLLLLWIAAIVASLIRAFTGFGFALAAVPGFALVLAPGEAVVLSAMLAVCIGVQTFPRYADDAAIGEHRLLYGGAVLGTVVGAQILHTLDADLFKVLIGSLTILAGLVLTRIRPRPRKRGRLAKTAAGIFSGLVNGAFAIPGPPVIIYALAAEASPDRTRSFLVVFFTFSGVVALSVYALSGLVGWESLLLALWVYPGILLGDKIGSSLFVRYATGHHRRIAVGVLLLLGCSIALRGLLG